MMKSVLPTIFAACLLMAAIAAHAQTQCWAPREEQGTPQKPQAAAMRKAVLAAEEIIRKDQAYLDSHIPVRMRTTMAIGPTEFISARMSVNAYPEYSIVGHHVWHGECDVIPQADRIDSAVGQIGVFFNQISGILMPPGATFVPKFEGMVAGYPRYNGWIYMSKDGRLPWIPETLGQRLDREIAARERALAAWMKNPMRTKPPQDAASVQKTYDMFKKTDPQGAERYLASMKQLAEDVQHNLAVVYPAMTRQSEKAVADARRYRAGFSAQELAAPAVWGDASGQGKKQHEARIQQLYALTPEEQQQVDAANREGRTLERQAQEATRAGNQQEAANLRAQVAELSAKVRAIKKAHEESVSNDIADASAEFDLTNLRPGDKEHAMAFLPDPDFFDKKNPYRVQLVTVLFSIGKRPGGAEWMKRAQESFDFAALAALLN
jgi:hypothetical protein